MEHNIYRIYGSCEISSLYSAERKVNDKTNSCTDNHTRDIPRREETSTYGIVVPR